MGQQYALRDATPNRSIAAEAEIQIEALSEILISRREAIGAWLVRRSADGGRL